MIVVTAGHVDHGKSTLIRALTGKETDRLEQEKTRGLSIDLGFAYLHFVSNPQSSAPREEVISFVDVPGHSDYINNMLAGVGSANAALLVISAVEGIKPQTREHLTILDLLGIKKGLIVLSFADKVPRERVAEVEKEVIELAANTSLSNVPIIPVSTLTGDGIPSVIAYLKTLKINEPSIPNSGAAYFRYCVDRCFNLNGVGTVVTGTVVAGAISRDSQIAHANSAKQVRLKSLFRDTEEITKAHQGDRIALGIKIDKEQVRRGDWIVNPSLNFGSRYFDARIRMAAGETIEKIVRLRSNSYLHLYLGGTHKLAQLRYLKQDDGTHLVQVRCKDDVYASFADHFILRDAANKNTLAGGHVLDIFSPKQKPNSPARLAMLGAMSAPDKTALGALIKVSEYGVSLERFSLARNIQAPLADKLLSLFTNDEHSFERFQLPSISSTGYPLPTLLNSEFYQQYCNVIIDALKTLHSDQPSRAGINAMELLIAIKFSGDPLLFSSICQRMIEQMLVMRSGALFHLPDHRPPQDAEAKKLIAQIREYLIEEGFVALRVFELMEITSLPKSTLENLLRANVNSGQLVQLSRNRFYLPETIRALQAFIESLIQEAGTAGLSIIQFRDKSGIGRNLCVEILEYFDKQGVTRRRGNTRHLRSTPF
jgi:selenocysteine-specific elongation factor